MNASILNDLDFSSSTNESIVKISDCVSRKKASTDNVEYPNSVRYESILNVSIKSNFCIYESTVTLKDWISRKKESTLIVAVFLSTNVASTSNVSFLFASIESIVNVLVNCLDRYASIFAVCMSNPLR